MATPSSVIGRQHSMRRRDTLSSRLSCWFRRARNRFRMDLVYSGIVRTGFVDDQCHELVSAFPPMLEAYLKVKLSSIAAAWQIAR
jgi:hypothetical protein